MIKINDSLLCQPHLHQILYFVRLSLIPWLQNVIFVSQIMYNFRSFNLCGYLYIEYVLKFAEFKHQVCIASEVISNS